VGYPDMVDGKCLGPAGFDHADAAGIVLRGDPR
jgi:hypothetical protein